MDSIGANDNVSCVLGAVFGLNMHTSLDCVHTENTFTCQDSVFKVEVFEKSLQEHLSVDKNLWVAGSVASGLVYPNRRDDFLIKKAMANVPVLQLFGKAHRLFRIQNSPIEEAENWLIITVPSHFPDTFVAAQLI